MNQDKENKNNQPKILKLKFNETSKNDDKLSNQKIKNEKEIINEKQEFKNNLNEIETSNSSIKGIPQIIKTNIAKNKPFRKKTFVPKNKLNENKFAPKKTIKKENFYEKKPIKKSTSPFQKFGISPNIQSFSPINFEKKSPSNDPIKKRKNNKKESTRPKTMTYTKIKPSNLIGKIEDLNLEDSEYYKIKKFKKNNTKNASFIQKTVELETEISFKELANMLSTKLDEILKQAKFIGCDDSMMDSNLVNIEILEMIANSLGHKVIRKDSMNSKKFDVFNIKIDEKNSLKRPPVVAIVGHVDHGKTSLLDKIRKSNLTRNEIGGITQKIGAYSVKFENDFITFIDTPGHAAFSKMREAGININDITILVISAVEGIKEQTIEAIKKIKKSHTQLIVVGTKCDLPNTNIEKIKQELANNEILVKNYGGDVEFIEVSSVTGYNIDFLLKTIISYADLMNLKANYNTNAIGVILEARVDAKIGILSTFLIQQGTLKIGDLCSTPKTFGKIKGIWNDTKKSVKVASPGMAVEVLGLNDCPSPGENFAVLSHDLAVELTKKNSHITTNEEKINLNDLLEDKKKALNLILNADTKGALEALENVLKTLETNHSTYEITKKSVGKIKDSDLDLAELTNAIIINYGMSIGKDTEQKAKNKKINIISSRVIYELKDTIQEELEKLITLIEEQVYLGTASVKRIFKSSKIGNISGSIVTEGKIIRGGIAKVFRKNDLVFEGKIESLKKGKDDVKEILNGIECGIFLNYKNVAVEDEIKCYKIEYKKPS